MSYACPNQMEVFSKLRISGFTTTQIVKLLGFSNIILTRFIGFSKIHKFDCNRIILLSNAKQAFILVVLESAI